MKRNCVKWALLGAMIVVAVVGERGLSSASFSCQAAQRQSRSFPIFEVDHAWPKVPAKWKLGDASSIAIDAQDHIWVLHRPRTLKPEQAAMAAPPVIVFDGAGNYIQAWGGGG